MEIRKKESREKKMEREEKRYNMEGRRLIKNGGRKLEVKDVEDEWEKERQ